MRRQDATDPLRPRRLRGGEVAAAPGHQGVRVGLVRVAVGRVHVVVIVVVVIIIVVVVVLRGKSRLDYALCTVLWASVSARFRFVIIKISVCPIFVYKPCVEE